MSLEKLRTGFMHRNKAKVIANSLSTVIRHKANIDETGYKAKIID